MKNRAILDILLNLTICITICFCVNHPVNAQSMKLVIGQYECTNNDMCGDDSYCDIETHRCTEKCACEVCPEPLVCEAGKSNLNGVCVECVNSNDCPFATPYCDNNKCTKCPSNRPIFKNGECKACSEVSIRRPYYLNNQCVRCLSDINCSGDTPVCNPKTNSCEECRDDSSCPNGLKCTSSGKCVHCLNDGHCPENKPICDTATNQCWPCHADVSCPNDLKCAPTGACVTCINNTHCSGDKPICDTNTYTCQPCSDDASCPNGTKCASSGACIQCTDDTHCSTNAFCDMSTNMCQKCQSPNRYWSKANKTCAPCPDGTTQSNGKCIIDLGYPTVNACPWGPAPGWQNLIHKFGPYDYDFRAYVDGFIDDQLLLYVNSTNMPTGSRYNSSWTGIDGTVAGAVGFAGYNVTWTNHYIGTLKKGDYGSFLLVSDGGCIRFHSSGHIWLELVE